MHVTPLLFLTFLLLVLCGLVRGFVISQPHTSVRIQLGSSTIFHCHVQKEGPYLFFWIKVPLQGAAVHIANVHLLSGDRKMFGQFKNNSRIQLSLKESNLSLLFSYTELTDAATYICGAQGYEELHIGNGSELIVENTAGTESTIPTGNDRNVNWSVFDYAVPVLSASNVATIIIIIVLLYCLVKKNKSDVTRPEHIGNERNADDVIYCTPTFLQAPNYNPLRRTDTPRRTSEEEAVTYQVLKVSIRDDVYSCAE